MDFTYGELTCDRDNGLWLVRDERRERDLRSELGIDWRLKEDGESSDYVLWNAGWQPSGPETPYITLRVDCSGKQGDPVPTDEEMREIMADHALEIYGRAAPVDRFSVLYNHHAVNAKHGGIEWNIITVDLPEGTALTREQIPAAPLTVR